METTSCKWSKENNLHLKKKENAVFDNWTIPSDTFILRGAVTGQNRKGQCGDCLQSLNSSIVWGGLSRAEHSSRVGAWSEATEPSQPWAAPGFGAWVWLQAHEELSLSHPAAVLGAQGQEGPFLPKTQIFLLELWKINTELLMVKPADCGESVRASTLEG